MCGKQAALLYTITHLLVLRVALVHPLVRHAMLTHNAAAAVKVSRRSSSVAEDIASVGICEAMALLDLAE